MLGLVQREPGKASVPVGALFSVLRAVFNVAALNMLWLVASLAVVTVPATVCAAFRAIYLWLEESDDRVARNFCVALWCQRRRAYAVCAVPTGLLALSVLEVVYFGTRRVPFGGLCLGIGIGLSVGELVWIGYVWFLSVTTDLSPRDVWQAAAGLAAANLFVTGPLSVLELGGGLAVGVLDPGLVVVGIPAVVLLALYRTAKLGARRAVVHAASLERGERRVPSLHVLTTDQARSSWSQVRRLLPRGTRTKGG